MVKINEEILETYLGKDNSEFELNEESFRLLSLFLCFKTDISNKVVDKVLWFYGWNWNKMKMDF